MLNKITAIIPTGMRPEAYALCERWVKSQTLQPNQIIVIDDGEVPTEITLDATIILPERKWRLGDTTQKRNLLIGLEEASGDILCILEDDDWFSPNYLQYLTVELLNPKYDLQAVGELGSRYYNIKHKKFRLLKNRNFSPLSQTIFRKSLIPYFKEVLTQNDSKFDVNFWRSMHGPRYLLPTTTLTVGIKGVPGRPGLGIGHNPADSNWQKDTDKLDQLKRWIGEDVEFYRGLT